ncbi:MAG TPA: membrane protein insertase YidC [Polyangia bacterium]|jgi:YidC/Oxa1 family membrane protein insertase|nr:membrane protein insertase YidC [Polyangia bacterium]
MEKRVLIALIICAGIFVAWQQFLAPKPPVSTPVTATAPTPAAPPPAPATSAPAAGTPPAAPGAPAPADNHPEREIELLTPEVRFVLSSAGGTLRHAQLRDSKYFLRKGDPSSGYDVVRTLDAQTAPFRISFPGSAFAAPGDGTWQVSQPAPNTVVFRAETEAVAIEKRYVTDSARYRLRLDVTVENKSAKPQSEHLAIHVFTRQDPEGKSGGFFGGSSANTAAILCHISEKTERTPVEKLWKDKEVLDKTGTVRWVGADEKFFLVAAVPHPESPPRDRKCIERGLPGGLEEGEGVLSFTERELAPGERTSYPFDLFVGPKIIDDLEKVRPGGEPTKLTEAVDVTLAWLSGPILTLLNFFHRFSHNWGLAIILLTVFIKLVTFYPTQRSLLSAKKMQKLGPKMAAIRKKYENDRQRQSTETMNLYKAHGVSPLGGCLPSLIQMPIWIALYSTLNYAVELHRSPFILHIHDLTAKDPFYVTPLLMGGVMFLQMKMSPASPDNQQQAMMSVMMPIMFTAFSLVLPSGLALYMLTSYLIGILQQLYVNHVDRKAGGAA